MEGKWLKRMVQAAAMGITMAAIFQELEKPGEEREWHGTMLGIPYEFRLPTLGRFKASYWNPETSHILTPEVFGIGWAINFHAVLEKLRLLHEAYSSEEDYLMPTRSIRKTIEHSTP